MAKQREKAFVSVAVCDDLHVLEAVSKAYEMGIAKFILVGNKEKTESIAKDNGIDLSDFTIIDEADSQKACEIAVKYVKNGEATAVMKGLIDTSVIMKAVLNKENGIRTGSKLSHIAAFEVPSYHKLLYVTDAAINIDPDFETKKAIIENAAMAVKNLGIEKPKVALLAAKEKADPKMPVTMEYVQLVEMNKSGEFSGAILDGPLALDNAVSKEAAEIKGIVSDVAGDADILFCPNIEAGNILYKSLSILANAKTGGVVLGAKRPVVLTSRSDTAESKLISIALSVLF